MKRRIGGMLFILLNDLRNLFIFCTDVDIDEVLLLDKNKGLGIDTLRVISLCGS